MEKERREERAAVVVRLKTMEEWWYKYAIVLYGADNQTRKKVVREH